MFASSSGRPDHHSSVPVHVEFRISALQTGADAGADSGLILTPDPQHSTDVRSVSARGTVEAPLTDTLGRICADGWIITWLIGAFVVLEHS